MRVNCKVSKIESVKNNIYKVYITPANVIDFKAGQYLFIDLNDKKQPFSIANCPTEKGSIELYSDCDSVTDYASDYDYDINNLFVMTPGSTLMVSMIL